MRVYLLRHGATEYNAQRRYQGATDSPLSRSGRDALGRADIEPEMVYISRTVRARQTAEILFPNAALIEVPDLREMDFGAFEGKNYVEMEHDADYRAWVDGGCVGQTPGGEDRAGFSRRVCSAFAALVENTLADGRDMLVIVAHGGTQMAALERFGSPARDYWDWQSPLGGGFVLETDAERWAKTRTLTLVGAVQYAKEPS